MMASVPPNIVGPSSNKDMLVARCISREFNCISRRTYVRMRTSMHNCLCILMYIFMKSDFSRPVLVLHISFTVYKLVMVRPRPLSGRCSATIYLTRAVTTARTPPASNGPKCTCTVVAVYPVTSAYHARDSTCHAHSLAFVKFEVPFLPIDP